MNKKYKMNRTTKMKKPKTRVSKFNMSLKGKIVKIIFSRLYYGNAIVFGLKQNCDLKISAMYQ